jgi:hypothetical protein
MAHKQTYLLEKYVEEVKCELCARNLKQFKGNWRVLESQALKRKPEAL